MKDSEFRSHFDKPSSLGQLHQAKPEKPKRFPLWSIIIAMIVLGLPVYMYLFLTGKMFEFGFIKKIFDGSAPVAIHRPTHQSKPDKPWITRQPGTDQREGYGSRAPQPSQDGELIYSWIDEDGVKRFSNVQPTGLQKDLKVATAYRSEPSKKTNRRRSLSAASHTRETRVYIQNNQILVPVKLGNNGREVSTRLLLDTGATTTSIHDDLAARFGYFDYEVSRSRIADGSMVNTKSTHFDYIIVGPYRMKNFNTLVMEHKGPPEKSKGLLGMNFLKNVKYQVDYSRQVIKWL